MKNRKEKRKLYRKKERIIIFSCIFVVLGLCGYLYFSSFEKETKVNQNETLELIQIKLEGEVVRVMEVTCTRPISYGALFLRLKQAFNEFSDLSGFSFEEMITESLTILIPSNDIYSQYIAEEKINIHLATFEDLLKLPQIGEKRAKIILDYIQKNGKFDSWETFFRITSIPEHAKIQIQRQAFL